MATEKREFIDPNELMRYINENHSYAGLPMAAHICTMELLTYAPRVDAVEVVRCWECKHWMYEYDDVGLCVTDVPDVDGVQRRDIDYCSLGERKDNE